ncbi:hypothetical protein OUZ56_004861 [Daphnia magna]|uniref:Secreted protein n=1 Tax=Daphnia magna TaxID=35525 RepID=A0ABQ9YR32_9CRUS|nr:hypothetical protein OUZ56_004861 [Daphnia magna]
MLPHDVLSLLPFFFIRPVGCDFCSTLYTSIQLKLSLRDPAQWMREEATKFSGLVVDPARKPAVFSGRL